MNRRAFFGLLAAAVLPKPRTAVVMVPRQYGMSHTIGAMNARWPYQMQQFYVSSITGKLPSTTATRADLRRLAMQLERERA